MEDQVPTGATKYAPEKQSQADTALQKPLPLNSCWGQCAFLLYLWDLLLPQAKLTVNLLHQATINPKISTWEYFNGLFDFNKTPLAPVGCRVLIHAKSSMRQSWDYRAKHGFYIGPALDGPLQLL